MIRLPSDKYGVVLSFDGIVVRSEKSVKKESPKEA